MNYISINVMLRTESCLIRNWVASSRLCAWSKLVLN